MDINPYELIKRIDKLDSRTRSMYNDIQQEGYNRAREDILKLIKQMDEENEPLITKIHRGFVNKQKEVLEIKDLKTFSLFIQNNPKLFPGITTRGITEEGYLRINQTRGGQQQLPLCKLLDCYFEQGPRGFIVTNEG